MNKSLFYNTSVILVIVVTVTVITTVTVMGLKKGKKQKQKFEKIFVITFNIDFFYFIQSYKSNEYECFFFLTQIESLS